MNQTPQRACVRATACVTLFVLPSVACARISLQTELPAPAETVEAPDGGVSAGADAGAFEVRAEIATAEAPLPPPGVETLATGQPGPLLIAVSKDSVYWTCMGGGKDGSVRSMGKTDKKLRVLASSLDPPVRVTLLGDAPFWVASTLTVTATTSLWTFDPSAGAPRSVADGVQKPFSISASGAQVVVGSYLVSGAAVSGTDLMLFDKYGSRTPAASLPVAASTVASDDSAIAWGAGGKIYLQKRGTSSAVVISDGVGRPLYVDATHVYATDGKVVARAKRDGSGTEILGAGYNGVEQMAGDATEIVWSERGASTADGAIWRALKIAPKPTVVAAGQAFPIGVAMDAKRFYWVASSAGAVLAIHR